jgi:hypothetical protein
MIKTRLVGSQIWESGSFPLGSDFYPPSSWKGGDVIRQSVFFQLPDNLTAGSYDVQIQVLHGSEQAVQDTWTDIFSFVVEARKHNYIPPLIRTRREVRFGDVLRLRGYNLDRKNVHPGEKVEVTVYWQALKAPTQIYAVFNHLRDDDAVAVWQGDSWPQAGIYTTDRWLQNEIVAEKVTIVIPVDLAAGDYSLYSGVYDPLTGDRLVATTKKEGRLLNDEFILLRLTVLP